MRAALPTEGTYLTHCINPTCRALTLDAQVTCATLKERGYSKLHLWYYFRLKFSVSMPHSQDICYTRNSWVMSPLQCLLAESMSPLCVLVDHDDDVSMLDDDGMKVFFTGISRCPIPIV